MMSNSKDRREKNDDDELSEDSQNAEIIICQKSNIIFKTIFQSETRNDNEKPFNYRFNENDVVDYIVFVEKK